MSNFVNPLHAVIYGRVLERLRSCGNEVRPVLTKDGEYTDTIQIEIGTDRTEWVDLVVTPWAGP